MLNSDSSDEENMIIYYHYRRRRYRNREYWVHPYLYKNINCRLFVAAKELEQTDSKFIAFYRMSKQSYIGLVQMIAPMISKQNTNMRECVSAEERILITLRYLATGGTFVSLSLYFCRGETTVGCITAETTKMIWIVLSEVYMPMPSCDQWKMIAERFESLWNLPNCIGALDGKHVRIEKFPNTGSTNYNYKSYHLVILMARCDADGLFTIIETGYAGRNSDGDIFRASALKHFIANDRLNIPSPSPLKYDETGCPFPYYFVADNVFSLLLYLMRSHPNKVLNNQKRIFNYRLSSGRKTIECAFGMAAKKFAILNGPIRCRNPKTVNEIIKAACVLHNYVRKREGLAYIPRHLEDNDTTSHYNSAMQLPTEDIIINPNSTGAVLRNYLSNYFVTTRASLPWQWKYCI